MFLSELKRAFKRRTFALSIFIGLILIIYNVYKYIPTLTIHSSNYELFPQGSYHWWAEFFSIYNGTGTTFLIIAPLLSAVVFSDSYIEDYKSGMFNSVFTRIYVNKYLNNKFLINFIVAGFTYSILILSSFIIWMLLVPSIMPNAIFGDGGFVGGSLYKIYYTHPIIYIYIYIYIIEFFICWYLLFYSSCIKYFY